MMNRNRLVSLSFKVCDFAGNLAFLPPVVGRANAMFQSTITNCMESTLIMNLPVLTSFVEYKFGISIGIHRYY